MNYQRINFPKIILFFGCLIFVNIIIAQNDKEFSEELKYANRSLYQDAKKAIAVSKDVFTKAKYTDTKISALITLVNAYNADNQNEQALLYATKAHKLADSSGNLQYRIWTLGLLGEQYQLSHLNTISREYLDKAEELIEHANLSKTDFAVSKGNIFAIKANGYKDEIDCEYAIKNYDLAIQSYLSIADETAAENNLALVYLEKGNCLFDLQKLKMAEHNFTKSLSIAKKNGLKEYSQFANLGLARIANSQGRFQTSVDSLQTLFKEIDNKTQPELQYGIYSLLADNYLVLDSLSSYRHFEEKRVQALKEMKAQKNRQFQQVIKFVEQDRNVEHKKFKIEEILFYILLITIVLISIFELFKRQNRV